MNDRKKIYVGIAILVIVVTFPFWYGLVATGGTTPPELWLPPDATECIEETGYMTSDHMVLLNEWRDAVVREGEREYVSPIDGKTYEMSLTNGCMTCHVSKVNFCDQCHNYAGVSPYCWDCHVEPVEPVAAGGR